LIVSGVGLDGVQNNPGLPDKCIVQREKPFDLANFPNFAATPFFEGHPSAAPIFLVSRNGILWWFFRPPAHRACHRRNFPLVGFPFWVSQIAK